MAKLTKQRLNHLHVLIGASELAFERKQLVPEEGFSEALPHQAASVDLAPKPPPPVRAAALLWFYRAQFKL